MLVEWFDSLRVLDLTSGLVRMACAVICGGLIGLDRGRKGRAAGFRTYMLVCLGAAMTMMLGQYEALMLANSWDQTSGNTDVSRFGAQVINGIGFLGAGTIILTGRQKVKGVTTAAGLWAAACMGLALGAGFYECALLGFVLILICFRILPLVEESVLANSRNINLCVELGGMEMLSSVLAVVKELEIHIYDVELQRGAKELNQWPGAVLYLRLPARRPHAEVLAQLSRVEGVRSVYEV